MKYVVWSLCLKYEDLRHFHFYDSEQINDFLTFVRIKQAIPPPLLSRVTTLFFLFRSFSFEVFFSPLSRVFSEMDTSVFGVYRSATTFKWLTADVNHVDYLVTMQ